MDEYYIIKKSTLTNIANRTRLITGETGLLSLTDIDSVMKKISLNGGYGDDDGNTSYFYVGMMQPYDTVGKDGDIFFLV